MKQSHCINETAALTGVILGAERIPEKWKNPLHDKIETYVVGFKNLKIPKYLN